MIVGAHMHLRYSQSTLNDISVSFNFAFRSIFVRWCNKLMDIDSCWTAAFKLTFIRSNTNYSNVSSQYSVACFERGGVLASS